MGIKHNSFDFLCGNIKLLSNIDQKILMHDDTIKIVKYTSKIHVSNNVNHHCSWGTNACGFLG